MSSRVIAGADGSGCDPILVSAADRSTGLNVPGSGKPVTLTTSPIAKVPRACDATSTPPVSSLTQVGPVGLVSSTTPFTDDGSSPRVVGVNWSSSAIVDSAGSRAASTMCRRSTLGKRSVMPRICRRKLKRDAPTPWALMRE